MSDSPTILVAVPVALIDAVRDAMNAIVDVQDDDAVTRAEMAVARHVLAQTYHGAASPQPAPARPTRASLQKLVTDARWNSADGWTDRDVALTLFNAGVAHGRAGGK